MHEFYWQKMIYLQFVKMMGMGEKPQEKKKKKPFGYPLKTSQTFPNREGRLVLWDKRKTR